MNNGTVGVVTGANNGIGFHMSKALLEAGYCVAGLDLSGENLDSLQDAFAEQLQVCICDVTDDAQVNSSIESVAQRWGRIAILVNNACIALFAPFERRTLEETRREFEVNYFGSARMIAAVLPHMKGQRGGIIHNLSSGVGITDFPTISGYASTKGAIESLTRTLALEFAPYGICVNLMHPPLTNTKSAAPLGMPAQAMDDPAKVGRNLAKQIRSTKPVIASDLRTAIYLFFAYRYPQALGSLFAKLAENSKRVGQA